MGIGRGGGQFGVWKKGGGGSIVQCGGRMGAEGGREGSGGGGEGGRENRGNEAL